MFIKMILIDMSMKVLFVPARYKKELSKEFMQKILVAIKCEKVGLFTTVQFLVQLKQLEKFLVQNRKKVLLGEPKQRAAERGQVLGCDPSAAMAVEKEIDCFVYLGSGMFHPMALALESSKTILQANPLTGEVSELDRKKVEQFKKLKKEMLNKFSKAKTIGILISSKPGQENLKAAEAVKEQLEQKGKNVYMFYFDTLIPEELLNFPQIEAWVNTACPRISIDDIDRFDKPVVDAKDILKQMAGTL